MIPVISHVDLRVRNRASAEKFYGRIFDVIEGTMEHGKEFTTFGRTVERGISSGGHSQNWLGFTEDRAMVAGSTRVALYAPDRATVDKVAAVLTEIGAANIEWDDDVYGENYYAVFFQDPDGNPLEVCCYETDGG